MVNKGRYGLILVLSVLLSANLMAQKGTLKGYVYDSGNGQPVPYATIALEDNQEGTSSDVQGYYHLDGLVAGIYTVEIRCMGYKPLSEVVEIGADRPVIRNFLLEPARVELGEVSITADQVRQRDQITVSEISILPADIEQTPSVGGMSDIIQHLQVVPGVISRGDIGGQIYIRGGTPVQNKMVMDEAVIYSPVHSIGLFTVFDDGCIRNADLLTGGFGAEYGGSNSSVVDISTRYGNTMRLAGKAELSTIGTKLLLEGPLLKDSTMESASLSILFSAKNTHLERATDLYYSYLDRELPFYFLDLYSKLTLLVGKTFRANLYGFNYRDRVSYSTSLTDYSWTNTGFGGDIQLMPPRSSMLIKAYFAGSYFRMSMDEASYEPRYSDVNSLVFGFRFKKFMKNQTLNYGLEIMNLGTDYSYYSTAYNAFSQAENSTEVSAYFQYHLRLGRFLIDPGLRFQYYATLSKSSLEPRLAMKYEILENLSVKLAAGLYSQNLIGAVSDRDIVNFFQGYLSAPVDLVVPEGGEISDYYLQKSQHLILGLDADLWKKLFITVEGYYKNFPQMINFNKYKMLNSDHFPDAPDYLTRDFIVESGYAEGVDVTVLFAWNHGKAEAGYSYAVTKRRYDDPELGSIEYYPQYDRRHNLNLSGTYRFGISRLWEASARWNYGSGFPYTPSAGYYETVTFDEDALINHLTSNGSMGIIYGEYNSARLPSYHRLDASVLRRFLLGDRTVFEAEFSIINMYNRENIFYIDRRTNEQVYQLPFLPSLRLSLEF